MDLQIYFPSVKFLKTQCSNQEIAFGLRNARQIYTCEELFSGDPPRISAKILQVVGCSPPVFTLLREAKYDRYTLCEAAESKEPERFLRWYRALWTELNRPVSIDGRS